MTSSFLDSETGGARQISIAKMWAESAEGGGLRAG